MQARMLTRLSRHVAPLMMGVALLAGAAGESSASRSAETRGVQTHDITFTHRSDTGSVSLGEH